MKKIFFAALSAVLAVSSCQKNEILDPQPKARLHAQVEQVVSTKTTMDADRNILWSDGDQVIAFMKSTLGSKFQVTSESVGETSADFEEVTSGNGGLHSGNEISHNVVYYPYLSSVKCRMSGGDYALSVDLPSEQTYAEGSFGNGAMPMVAVSESANITFRNVSGGMKLQLKGSQKVASVKVEGKNGEKLSGAATVTAYAGGDKPSIVMSDAASTFVTLDCGEGVQLSESAATDFIIALPPVEFVSGFKVTVTDSWGYGYIIETSKKNTVIRSSLLVMPVKTLGEPDILAEGLYIDEYGINRGRGVDINGVVWAPVNCGYHETDYPYGKLYQWGRKYGQGHFDAGYGDVTSPVIKEGGISIYGGQSEANANVIFDYWDITLGNEAYDWVYPSDNSLWNAGTEDEPVKTCHDPCPDGWRVPTYTEILSVKYISDYSTDESGRGGYWIGVGSSSDSGPKVFLPEAGSNGMSTTLDHMSYYWSSTADYSGYEGYPIALLNSGCHLCYKYVGISVRCVYDPEAYDVDEPSEDVSEINVQCVYTNPSSLSLFKGETAVIPVKYLPSDATNTDDAVWRSSDPSVATVESDGTVRGVSAGEAVITVDVSGVTADCSVNVSEPVQLKNYVDEYGKDRGKGVVIGTTVWAPVNCGYHETDYPWGKMYQWGRKYGQGYFGGSDATEPITREGYVSLEEGQSEANANVFFLAGSEGADWLSPSDDALWNAGTEDSPVKTQYDPCPDGWRVPTTAELRVLSYNYSSWTTNEKGQPGLWLSGISQYSSSVSQIFLPAAGQMAGGEAAMRGEYGSYWSSEPWGTSPTPYSYMLLFHGYDGNGIVGVGGAPYRACGLSVRCVQE